jgi:hypothetical protein
LVVGMSEHLACIEAVSLRELASRLSAGPLSVENPLHRIEYVAGPFRCSHVGQRSALIDCEDDLSNLGFRWFFRIFDIFNLLVVLVGQIGQVMLEAHHAVVGGFVCALLCAVLFGYLVRLFLALAESVAEIVGRIALLVREWTSLGIAQHICEMHESSFNFSAVQLAVQ